jgi:hypothetical protein
MIHKDMKSGKAFFMVNAKSKPDLLDKNLVLLFGTNEYMRERVLKTFPDIIRESNVVLSVRSGDTVIDFYYGAEEVIDKFVLADVYYSESPHLILLEFCRLNSWHLYDFEKESYL